VGPDNIVNPQLGVGVQGRAIGLDSHLGAELHSHASKHIPPSLGVGLRDHGYGDDPLGGLVWRDEALRADGIPPPGTVLRDRASKLGEGPERTHAPPGPSGDQVTLEGKCEYVSRGWEVTPTGDAPLWPKSDGRKASLPHKI
jgi:hypothetical protein